MQNTTDLPLIMNILFGAVVGMLMSSVLGVVIIDVLGIFPTISHF